MGYFAFSVGQPAVHDVGDTIKDRPAGILALAGQRAVLSLLLRRHLDQHGPARQIRRRQQASQIGKAANESRDQVFRYIRLTNLIPDLLQLVDEERIALTPAVELSYLTEQEQYDLMSTIESEDCTPSLSQAQRLKKLSQAGQLNADKIFAIMSEEKANQKERISFPFEDVRRFFPKSYTQKDVYNAILKLIGEDYQRRERSRKNRDER